MGVSLQHDTQVSQRLRYIGVNSIAISNLPTSTNLGPIEKIFYRVQCSELTMVIRSSAREV